MTIDWCGDLVLENVGSGARSARRLNFNHGYVDLQSGNSARRYYVMDHLGSVNDTWIPKNSDNGPHRDVPLLGLPLLIKTASIFFNKAGNTNFRPVKKNNRYQY